MLIYALGILTGTALLTLIAFVDAKVKKKKLAKLMKASFLESCETYGFNIPKSMKGD